MGCTHRNRRSSADREQYPSTSPIGLPLRRRGRACSGSGVVPAPSRGATGCQHPCSAGWTYGSLPRSRSPALRSNLCLAGRHLVARTGVGLRPRRHGRHPARTVRCEVRAWRTKQWRIATAARRVEGGGEGSDATYQPRAELLRAASYLRGCRLGPGRPGPGDAAWVPSPDARRFSQTTKVCASDHGPISRHPAT